jgi:hypothetical protein
MHFHPAGDPPISVLSDKLISVAEAESSFLLLQARMRWTGMLLNCNFMGM